MTRPLALVAGPNPLVNRTRYAAGLRPPVTASVRCLLFMLIDGVIFEARCPSPPRAVGAHRAVIAASRSGSVGTQVVASAGRSRGNASPKVVGYRAVAAVPETRSSSRRQLSVPVAACVSRSRGDGSHGALSVAQPRPELWTHLTNCCSRRLTPSPVCSRGQLTASSVAERHR